MVVVDVVVLVVVVGLISTKLFECIATHNNVGHIAHNARLIQLHCSMVRDNKSEKKIFKKKCKLTDKEVRLSLSCCNESY